MYPKDIPDIVSEQYNQTSLDNISDALKKVWPYLARGKNCGVKPLSYIKYDNTHEEYYLDCEAY